MGPKRDFDDGICGEADSEDEGRKKQRANRRSAEDIEGDVCHLCLESVAGEPVMSLKMMNFHKGACYNAVRCRRRLVGPDGLKEEDRYMLERSEDWRLEVVPLRAGGGQLRCAMNRRSAKTKVSSQTSYVKSAEHDTDLVVNKTRYVSHRMFWDRIGSSEASSDFERLHEFQEGAEDSDEKPQVRVQDVKRRVKEKGLQHDNRTEYDTGCDDGAQRDRQRGEDGGQPPGGARGRDRDRQRGNRSDRGGSLGDRQNPSRVDRKQRQCASDDRPVSRRPLTAAALADLMQQQVRLAAAGARLARQPSPPESGSAVVASPGKLRPLQFMQERSKLKDNIVKEKEKNLQKGSIGSKLKDAIKKLTAAELKSMDSNPSESTKEVDRVAGVLDQLHNDLEGAKAQTFQSFVERADKAFEELVVAEAQATDTFDAVSFILGEKQRIEKKEANDQRYARTRVQHRLESGGFSKVLAKELTWRLTQPDKIEINPEKFKPGEISMWMATDDQEKNKFYEAYLEFQETFKDVEERITLLAESLNEKPKWKGAVTRLDSGQFDFGKLDLQEPKHKPEDAGAAPWVVAMRMHSWRFGPALWPLPGFGSFISVLTGSADVYIIALAAGKVLGSGVALKDFSSFLTTPSGLKLFGTDAFVVKVPCKGVVWIPFGWLSFALPMTAVKETPKPTEEKDDEQTTAAASEWKNLGVVASWTPFLPKTVSQEPPEMWKAIHTWNLEHCKQMSQHSMWKDRTVFLESFAEAVQTASGKA
jgi:hypothetical protein